MAEIYTINIDSSEAVQALASAQTKVKELKQQLKELNKAEGDHANEIAATTIELQQANSEMRTVNRLISANTAANEANDGSLASMRAQVSALTNQYNQLSAAERDNDEIGGAMAEQINELRTQINTADEGLQNFHGNVGNYTNSITQALQQTGLMSPALSSATASVNTFGVAFKAALGPVGLVVAAIGLVVKALTAFFTSSEEGQNVLAKLQAVAGVVFGNINDLLSKLGEIIYKVLTEPKEALKSFGKFLKEQITNRIEGMLELIPALGSALVKVFKGQFKDAATTATDAMAKLTLGVEDFSEKATNAFTKAKNGITGLIDETNREIEIAKRLADQQAALDTQVRANLVTEARLRAEISEAKLKAKDDENYTAAEQLAYLDEAIAKEKQILANNEDIAAQKLAIKREQNSLSNSTKEDLDEEARLEAELIRQRQTNADRLKEITTERITLLNEIKTTAEAAAAAELAAFEKMIDDELEAEAAKYTKESELKAAAIEKEVEQETERIAKLKAAAELNDANTAALKESNVITELEDQKALLEQRYQNEVAYATKIGADVTLVDKKYAKARKEIAEAEFNAKVSLAADFAGDVATVFGETTAIGKAAAVAQATMQTYVAANSAYAALSGIAIVGPALGIAAAAAAVASGIANVKKILAVDTDSTSTSTTSSTSTASTASTISSVSDSVLSRTGSDIIDSSNIDTDSVTVAVVVDDVTEAQATSSSKIEASTI